MIQRFEWWKYILGKMWRLWYRWDLWNALAASKKHVQERNRACERPLIERQPSESEASALTNLSAIRKELGECPLNFSKRFQNQLWDCQLWLYRPACSLPGLIATLDAPLARNKILSSYYLKVILAMVYQHEEPEVRANNEITISFFAAPEVWGRGEYILLDGSYLLTS